MPPHLSLAAAYYQQYMSHAYTHKQNTAAPNKHHGWTLFCNSANEQPTEYLPSVTLAQAQQISRHLMQHQSHSWEICSLRYGLGWIKLLHWLHSNATAGVCNIPGYLHLHTFVALTFLVGNNHRNMKAAKARVKIQNNLTDHFEVKRGLKKGDGLAPLLFNMA